MRGERGEMRGLSILLGVTVATLGACGSGKATPAAAPSTSSPAPVGASPPTTADLASWAQRYTTAVADGNKAAGAFQTQAAALSASASSADVARIAGPLVAAFKQTDRNLLAVSWPASVQPDVDALVRADATFEGVLGAADSQSAFSAAAWSAQVSTAVAQLGAAVNIVRRDLGLPPSS